jgi:hypothetical protein
MTLSLKSYKLTVYNIFMKCLIIESFYIMGLSTLIKNAFFQHPTINPNLRSHILVPKLKVPNLVLHFYCQIEGPKMKDPSFLFPNWRSHIFVFRFESPKLLFPNWRTHVLLPQIEGPKFFFPIWRSQTFCSQFEGRTFLFPNWRSQFFLFPMKVPKILFPNGRSQSSNQGNT